MAYYDSINLVAGDSLPEINFTLRDSNTAAEGQRLDPDNPETWAPMNLNGREVRVKFRALGSKEVLDTLQCGIHSPRKDGKCFMQWNPDTLDVPAGTYEGEIELVDTENRHQTVFDRLKFKVRDDF